MPQEDIAQALRDRFAGAADFVERRVKLPEEEVCAFFIDGLVASGDISNYVLKPLVQGERVYNAVEKPVKDAQEAAQLLVNGFCVLICAGRATAYEVKTPEKRAPSAPSVENTVKGAKDAFTETVRTNTSLIRRHLRSPDLQLYETQVGARSLTNVSVVSLRGLTNPDYVAQVKRRLAEIDVDGLISPASVEEYLTGSRRTAFPMLSFTERTDKFCHGLLAGRVGVLVDGLPLGYLLPVDLGYLLQSPEDRGSDYVTASCVRVLRYLALLTSLFLPGLFVAMAAFEPQMLPNEMLLAIIESKKAVPFPTILEVLGLLVAFELLQEAGIHMPRSIGHTISIIGGLVVGTAAVEAKLISPAALIVVAVAGICGFCLPGQDFSDAVRVWRFVLTLCASAAGLFGLTAGAIALLIHLSGLRSLGVPYLAPFSRLGGGGEFILRRRLVRQRLRDPLLHPQDETNQAEETT